MTRKRKGLTARQSGFQGSRYMTMPPQYMTPKGVHGRRIRRPSYCFHTAYAKYANRSAVDAAMARGEVP